MVFSVPVCIFNVGSGLLVNGICAQYQMKEEEKRMEHQAASIRRSIRSELERNNSMQLSQDDDNNEIFASCVKAEKRRKFIVQQMSFDNPEKIKWTTSSLGDSLMEEEDEQED